MDPWERALKGQKGAIEDKLTSGNHRGDNHHHESYRYDNLQ